VESGDGQSELGFTCGKIWRGGHPRVSAISFEPGDLPRAREVARGLTATLRGK